MFEQAASLTLFMTCTYVCVGFIALLPQDAGADEPEAYTPFQFMLQFMLQPLLVASGGAPGGATAPALLKMCSILKFTADKAVSQHFLQA